MRLRLHITAVEVIRIAVIGAEEFFVQRFHRRRFYKHRVHPDRARKNGNVIDHTPTEQFFFTASGGFFVNKPAKLWRRISIAPNSGTRPVHSTH